MKYWLWAIQIPYMYLYIWFKKKGTIEDKTTLGTVHV